jgi:methionine-rich copper-binding protein CopC
MSGATHTLRRRVSLTAAVLLGITIAFTAASVPASAHGAVESMSPADGAALQSAPDRIEMEFATELAAGAELVVVDASGTNWADGEIQVDGRAATQPVQSAMPDGSYEVRWNVTFTDGHPLSGSSHFTVGAQAASAAVANPLNTRLGEAGVVAVYIIASAVMLALLVLIARLAWGVYGGRREQK